MSVSPGTATESLLVEQRGSILVITLNRPAAQNAIDNELATALVAASRQLDEDPNLAVGVVTGAAPSFCSGLDLKAFAKEGVPRDLHTFYMQGSSKPLIAAVEGYALGGGLEIALTCDLIVAAEDAKLGAPEPSVGLFAAGGGVLRLARRLPQGIAMEMALTAKPMGAKALHAYGLVNRVTQPGGALDAALDLAEEVCRNAPLAIRASKELVRESAHMSEPEFWEHQRAHARVVLKSNDAKEGPRAFAEKREPNWSGT